MRRGGRDCVATSAFASDHADDVGGCRPGRRGDRQVSVASLVAWHMAWMICRVNVPPAAEVASRMVGATRSMTSASPAVPAWRPHGELGALLWRSPAGSRAARGVSSNSRPSRPASQIWLRACSSVAPSTGSIAARRAGSARADAVGSLGRRRRPVPRRSGDAGDRVAAYTAASTAVRALHRRLTRGSRRRRARFLPRIVRAEAPEMEQGAGEQRGYRLIDRVEERVVVRARALARRLPR